MDEYSPAVLGLREFCADSETHVVYDCRVFTDAEIAAIPVALSERGIETLEITEPQSAEDVLAKRNRWRRKSSPPERGICILVRGFDLLPEAERREIVRVVEGDAGLARAAQLPLKLVIA